MERLDAVVDFYKRVTAIIIEFNNTDVVYTVACSGYDGQNIASAGYSKGRPL